jgi:hypothetical protein
VPFQEILFEPPANGQRRAPPLIDEDAVVLREFEEVIMFLNVGPDHSGIALHRLCGEFRKRNRDAAQEFGIITGPRAVIPIDDNGLFAH